MQYLVIMGILIVVAVILIVIIITALMRSRQDDESDYEGDEDEDDGYEDEDEVREIPGRRQDVQQEKEGQESEEEGLHVIGQGKPSGRKAASGGGEGSPEDEQDESRVPGKKLWKLVLENLATWQKSTFVFYENIGIGRGHSEPQFEKFMSIGDDPRISKLHCAVIQKDNKLYLKDMGSKNGTYLNDKRITQPVLIQREDVIRMGETEIEVLSMMREK